MQDAVISVPGLVNATNSGNLLMTTITGPMSITRMLAASNAVLPLVVAISNTNKAWGSVLVIENDATFFADSAEEYIRLVTSNPIYANRKRMAFVLVPGIAHSEETMNSLSSMATKISSATIQLFSDPVSAIKWASDI